MMTNWLFDPALNVGTLSLQGDMTIKHAGEFKESLMQAFAAADRVIVDVSGVTAVDVAGVQLLFAGQRFAAGRGQAMCLRCAGNDRFERFIDEVGIPRDFVCSHGDEEQCHWTPENRVYKPDCKEEVKL